MLFKSQFYTSLAAFRRFSTKCDLAVVGGGIIGTATAREVLKRRKIRVVLLEKESQLAVHQTGHNSGVIHAGVYYPPGSLKAKLCVESLNKIYDFCDENDVRYKRCGKLIVATNVQEETNLLKIFERGLANRVPGVEVVNAKSIPEIQPKCRGIRAIWSPNTGIIDYKKLTEVFADDFKRMGGDVKLDYKVESFKEGPDPERPVLMKSTKGEVIEAGNVVTCAGLYSDHIARMTGCKATPKIIPFRGEYLLLKPRLAKVIKTNIYPVPNPKLPFLGVHFTPRVNGDVWIGPNAILAGRREGYRWWQVSPLELFETLTYPGLSRLTLKHFSPGVGEFVRSAFPILVWKKLKTYIPDMKITDVKYMSGLSGVRAQAVNEDGSFVDDFLFDYGKEGVWKRVMHCRNAPSPAATSSFGISRMLVDEIERNFQLRDSEWGKEE